MAFRAFTEGECGQENPLNKLTSHVTRDYAFSESNGIQGLPSTSDQLVEQFLQETRAMPQTFRMDDLMREMHEIESQRSALPPVPASAVKDQLHDDVWAQQYLEDPKLLYENNYSDIWNEISAHSQEIESFKIFENACTPHKTLEIQQPNSSKTQEDASDVNQVDDTLIYSKFMKFMKNTEDRDMTAADGKLSEAEAQAWTDEFLHNTETTPIDEIWADEFDMTKDEEIKASFWDKLQEEFEMANRAGDSTSNLWADDFNTTYNIPKKEYQFSDDNPMLELPNPMEKGKELLNAGDFPSAVLCFEAAVKQQSENPEAWLFLGTTQAENEQDPSALAALNHCLQLDPTNLTALMSAAVSYTNESYYNQACIMLMNWLKYNSKYADLVPPDHNLSRQVSSVLVQSNQKLVQDLYLRAAQRNPQNVDYEVQCGLGVLCNLTGEYDKAADCFRAALSVRPNDARLWNRLGASLANGSKPEEAVESYHHALHLVPGFIRARYNVGITCINLRAYKEAVEHFLTALNQQARGKDVLNSGGMSQMSETIWHTMMMCVSLMDRPELREIVKDRNLQELNKIFNID